MSEGNGNGNGDGKPVEKSVRMMPGKNGGLLRRGGNTTPGSGRPPSAIREKLRGAAWKRVRELERIADYAKSDADRMRALDLMFKYGLGTTMTETDTEGNDVSVRVTREPLRLVGND